MTKKLIYAELRCYENDGNDYINQMFEADEGEEDKLFEIARREGKIVANGEKFKINMFIQGNEYDELVSTRTEIIY